MYRAFGGLVLCSEAVASRRTAQFLQEIHLRCAGKSVFTRGVAVGRLAMSSWDLLDLRALGGDMIKKVAGGYKVLSEKGKNLGGPYKTKAEAAKRLKQVEYFKHKGRAQELFDVHRANHQKEQEMSK